MEVVARKESGRMPREVWILSVVNFLIAVGYGVMSPVLPIYARTFGVSSFLIGLVVSSFAALRLLSLPLSSRLMRHIGARELAVLGCMLVAFTTFMIGVAHSFVGLVVWRGLSGCGSALFGVSSMALLFAAAPPHLRGRANALSSGGFVLGGMAGPALGGFIASISMQTPFFFYAATLVLASIAMAALLPRTPAGARQQLRETVVGLADLFKDRRFRAVIATNFAHGWQTFGVRGLLIPLFIVEVAHKSTTWVGVAFSVAAVAQALCLPVTGWSTDRIGRRFTLLAGAGITAAASIGFALTQSYVVMVVLLCAYSLGASATSSSAQATLADTVPSGASSGLATFQMAADIGVIIGPLAAGAVLDVASMSWAWAMGAVVILIGAVLAFGVPSTIQPPVTRWRPLGTDGSQ